MLKKLASMLRRKPPRPPERPRLKPDAPSPMQDERGRLVRDLPRK